MMLKNREEITNFLKDMDQKRIVIIYTNDKIVINGLDKILLDYYSIYEIKRKHINFVTIKDLDSLEIAEEVKYFDNEYDINLAKAKLMDILKKRLEFGL
jgi:hypothetical protein